MAAKKTARVCWDDIDCLSPCLSGKPFSPTGDRRHTLSAHLARRLGERARVDSEGRASPDPMINLQNLTHSTLGVQNCYEVPEGRPKGVRADRYLALLHRRWRLLDQLRQHFMQCRRIVGI
jgi:hypothetical protein